MPPLEDARPGPVHAHLLAGAPVAEGQLVEGKFRVERLLGSGAMGMVVLAKHVVLRQRVAIKFMTTQATREIAARFLREARAAARLKSDHVAHVLDVGELASGVPYMVMEYLDGEDLGAVLQRERMLQVDRAVDYVLHVCEAMAEAHASGIVHRDLKPSNLFVTKAVDGTQTVKVLDFGISKDNAASGAVGEPGEEGEMQLTGTGMVLGSPHYMAIEQMRSARTVDARADIWSIGAILYQLCTGQVPFPADTFPELVLKVIRDEPVPPSELRPEVPLALSAAILRCLAKDPDGRFPTVAALAAALGPFGSEEAPESVARSLRTLGITDPAAPDAGSEMAFDATILVRREEEARPEVAVARKPRGRLWMGVILVLALLFALVVARAVAPGSPRERTGAAANPKKE